MDEQNKQTQAYHGSVGPSKDSSEELNKEEEKLSKMPAGHVAFCGGMRVSCGMSSVKTHVAATSLSTLARLPAGDGDLCIFLHHPGSARQLWQLAVP